MLYRGGSPICNECNVIARSTDYVSDKTHEGQGYGAAFCQGCEMWVGNTLSPLAKKNLRRDLLNGRITGVSAISVIHLFDDVKLLRCNNGCNDSVTACIGSLFTVNNELYCKECVVRCYDCTLFIPKEQSFVCCGTHHCNRCNATHRLSGGHADYIEARNPRRNDPNPRVRRGEGGDRVNRPAFTFNDDFDINTVVTTGERL